MYTLRRISGEGVEMNFLLGQSYTVVSRDSAHYRFKEDFKRFFNSEWKDDEPDDNVYAFVGNEGGTTIYPLYEGQRAYIMIESGATFSNLTYIPKK